MKTVIAIPLALALATFLGCRSASPRGGGMAQDEGFKLVVPTFATEIKQGEVQIVEVSLQRGEFFKQDVTLETKPSKGISVEPAKTLVKASAKPEIQLRIIAAKDAAIGEYRIYVKGTPQNGEPTSAEFTVKVVAP